MTPYNMGGSNRVLGNTRFFLLDVSATRDHRHEPRTRSRNAPGPWYTPSMSNLNQIKGDIANVTDGSPWGASEWLSLSRLLAELGILLALVGPMVCSVSAPVDDGGTDTSSSGTESDG